MIILKGFGGTDLLVNPSEIVAVLPAVSRSTKEVLCYDILFKGGTRTETMSTPKEIMDLIAKE